MALHEKSPGLFSFLVGCTAAEWNYYEPKGHTGYQMIISLISGFLF